MKFFLIFTLFFTGCANHQLKSDFSGLGLLIVDSGVEQHDYLKDFFYKKISLIGNNTEDESGHGTHVSGILKTHLEVPSVNWMVKVESSTPNIDNKKIIKSLGLEQIINIAIQNDIKVISISMVYQEHDENILKLIKKAQQHNIFLVVGAGNMMLKLKSHGEGETLYPCGYKEYNVICVGSYLEYENEIKPVFSNMGKQYVDVWAKGNSVYSSDLNNTFNFRTGTSMATPKISASLVNFIYKNKNIRGVKLREEFFKTLEYSKNLHEFSTSGRFLPEKDIIHKKIINFK